jgi:transketolase
VQVRVLNVATIKPLDREAIVSALRDTANLVTVEDHSVIGGLGSAVAEVMAESGVVGRLTRLGHQDRFLPMGVPEDLMHLGGFDADALVAALCAQLNLTPPSHDDWRDRL